MVRELLINSDEIEPDSRSYSKKWEDKVVKALKMSGDKDWLIEECRNRFITSGYKLKYYEALKEVVSKDEWSSFLDKLWNDTDWRTNDYQDAEGNIIIAEKMSWLVAHVQDYMGLSAVVDRTIKEGIKQLIADYPDKYYFKSYLGSLL